MAEVASRAKGEYQQRRADIDTTLPYQNVKAAVLIFGEKKKGSDDNAKLTKSQEKNHGVANEAHLQELQQELQKTKSKLLDSEKERKRALLEIDNFRKLMNVKDLSIPKSGFSIADEENEERSVEKPAPWEIELKQEREHHRETLEELKQEREHHRETLEKLEASLRRSEMLERELSVVKSERESLIRQTEEANIAAEIHARRVEELMNEISGTKESLLLVKMACVETNREREALLAARQAEMDEQKASIQDKDSDSTTIRSNLCTATEALTKLERVGDVPLYSLELKIAKSGVTKAIENEEALRISIKELQEKLGSAEMELKLARSELSDMKSREEVSDSEIKVLRSEVDRVKSELKLAISCNEAFVGLSQKLREMAIAEEGGKRKHDLVVCTDNADARAELQSMINAEAEATRYAIERRKRNDDGDDGRLETLHEESAGTAVQICSYESLVATSSLPQGEHASTSFDNRKLASPREIAALDKGDHKKKKKFPLSSISMFVGKMKSHRISGGVAKQELG